MANVSTYEEFVSSGMKGKTRAFKPTDRKIGPQRPGPGRPGRPGPPRPGKPEQQPKPKHGNVTCADKLNDNFGGAPKMGGSAKLPKRVENDFLGNKILSKNKDNSKPSEGIKVKKTKLPKEKGKGLKKLLTKFTEFKGIR